MEFDLVHNYNKSKHTSDTKFEVKIRCYYSRKYRYIDTGIYIKSKYWDNGLLKSHPQYKSISVSLQNKLSEIRNVAYDYERNGAVFDFNVLISVCEHKDTKLFYSYILEELKKEKELDLKTFQKYKNNIEHIKRALPNVAVSRITKEHIELLDDYFRSELKDKDDSVIKPAFAQSTVARLHVFIQKYVKIAIKSHILNENPYDHVKLDKSRGEPKNVYLTSAEIERIENIKYLTLAQEAVRDRFLYSCYTGLRISDNLALLKSSLIDTEGGYIVNLHTIKGYGHDLIHPLKLMFDGKPEKIARRWMNEHTGDTLFPKMSTTYISEVLKIIANMSKIDKHLTFHVARHTCASLLADISQNPYLIKNILGHEHIKSSMFYIHASPESIKKQLRLLDNKWDTAR